MHYKHLDVLLYYCWLLFVDYDDWIYNDIAPGERMHLGENKNQDWKKISV